MTYGELRELIKIKPDDEEVVLLNFEESDGMECSVYYTVGCVMSGGMLYLDYLRTN